MHILILPTVYPNRTNPLIGIFHHEQAVALQKAGHRVGVLVPPGIGATLEVRSQIRNLADLRMTHELMDDLPVYRIHWGWLPSSMPKLRAKLVTMTGKAAFERYCSEQGRPDVIHAHNALFGGYLAVKLREQFHIPVVLTEHSSAFLRGFKIPNDFVRYTLEGVNHLLAVSPALANALSGYSPQRKAEVIGNGIDTHFFNPDSNWQASQRPFIFAAVTRFDRNKAIDVLLKAFATAFPNGTECLQLVGDGSERAALQTLAHELHIQNRVEFLGNQTREQVRDLLQRCHVLVSSSYVETFGVTLIEAMACGKPVIATRSGGPELFVNAENGLLVSPGDADALAGALREMVDAYYQYDSAHIRRECTECFSNEAIVKRLEVIYQSLG